MFFHDPHFPVKGTDRKVTKLLVGKMQTYGGRLYK